MWWVRLENWLRRPFLPGRKRGAAFTEYALLVALIAVALIATLTLFKGALESKFQDLATQISQAG